MFTNKRYENGDSLRKCFTKCLKIANAAMKDAENLYLLVAILNKYVYFYISDIEQITAGDVNKMIDLVNESVRQIKADGKGERAKQSFKYFENTIAAIKLRQKENPDKFLKLKVE